MDPILQSVHAQGTAAALAKPTYLEESWVVEIFLTHILQYRSRHDGLGREVEGIRGDLKRPALLCVRSKRERASSRR